MPPFKLPTRSQTDEHNVKYCHITSKTTVGELIKFLKGEFKAGDILKVVWGKEMLKIDNDKELLSNIIS
jgi:hypothetical protein